MYFKDYSNSPAKCGLAPYFSHKLCLVDPMTHALNVYKFICQNKSLMKLMFIPKLTRNEDVNHVPSLKLGNE